MKKSNLKKTLSTLLNQLKQLMPAENTPLKLEDITFFVTGMNIGPSQINKGLEHIVRKGKTVTIPYGAQYLIMTNCKAVQLELITGLMLVPVDSKDITEHQSMPLSKEQILSLLDMHKPNRTIDFVWTRGYSWNEHHLAFFA